jgi:hypothetical protein
MANLQNKGKLLVSIIDRNKIINVTDQILCIILFFIALNNKFLFFLLN